MIHPTRGDARCPICQGQAELLLELSFSKRDWLPDSISLASCSGCDFAFTTPADAGEYARYYSETTNDLLSRDDPSSQERERYRTQASFLSSLLVRQEPKRVLDIGCGNGGLLRHLQQLFGQHHYHGVDPNMKTHVTPEGITFGRTWQQLEEKFDLVVVSHALEHIVDLEEFSSIRRLLAPKGSMYIEVPDASRYADFPRREYLYYIDRLHLNHFTAVSLSRLMEIWGLSVTGSGRHDFRYKDSEPYPACWILATANSGDLSVGANAEPLSVALQRYMKGESARAGEWRNRLGASQEILVYGFGDNFFRCLGPNGPLVDCRVQAVIDTRWKTLRESRYADSYRFIDFGDALEGYAHLPVVVTLSWGAETVALELLDAGFRQVFIL